ncbi:MAG: transketolase family protein [Dehalococcoidales bacterium]|nr:transketolase family protein [Dehalococcoidales bacterium]
MSKTQNQRTAYGEELVSLGKENKDVVVLEADLGKSTMSSLFQAAFPERYFEMGIAEQNMLSTAAGLALSGKIVFANSFAVFVSGRAYDQIRQTISIGKLNVKICGSSAGFSDFGDGSTHQAIEDVAVMSAIPGMTVFSPCDAEETRQVVRAAAAIDGPVYIRVGRNDVPDYIKPEDTFEPGKMRVLKEGNDVVLFAHGTMVSAAMTAAAELEKQHISTRVVNISTMKPFNYAGVIELTRGAKAVVTAEEHSFIGGLASAVCLALRKTKIPVDYVAVEDCFGQSAHSAAELMIHYGLTSENIVSKVNGLLAGN